MDGSQDYITLEDKILEIENLKWSIYLDEITMEEQNKYLVRIDQERERYLDKINRERERYLNRI